MSYIRTITITKTESTPEGAFSNYPQLSPEQFVEFSSKYSATRTVVETTDSLIIKLIFPTLETKVEAVRDASIDLVHSQRDSWAAENHVVVTIDDTQEGD